MGTENRAASRLVASTFNELALQEAARCCREALGADPTVVIAHVTSDWADRLADVVEIVQVYGHAREIIGCSADGLITTEEERENHSGCVLMFLYLPDTELEVMALTAEEMERFSCKESSRDSSWMMLCNPYLGHAEKWMAQWNAATGSAPTFGGLASGRGGPEQTFVFRNRQFRNLACAALRFTGGIRIEGVVSQGCRPIGEPFTITEVDRNVVVGLASRPAYEVLEEAFASLSPTERELARGNLFAGLAISEYVEDFKRGDFLVRNILAGDPVRGVVAVGAFPRTGQTLQFQLRDRQSADEDLRVLCRETLQTHGTPFAGLLFSCTGRGARMFGTANHDAGVIANTFGRIPLSGFFCNGEIGPIGGCNFLHGYTASAAFLYHR